MQQVGCRAVAVDARGVGAADADVVEHGTARNEGLVGMEFGVAAAHFQGALLHLLRMVEQELAQGIVGRVVVGDDVEGL